MSSVTLDDAKANLSELIDQVEAGAAIEITRGGKPVARIVAIAKPRKPVDVERLRSLAASMPPQTEDAAQLVRSMRDNERY